MCMSLLTMCIAMTMCNTPAILSSLYLGEAKFFMGFSVLRLPRPPTTHHASLLSGHKHERYSRCCLHRKHCWSDVSISTLKVHLVLTDLIMTLLSSLFGITTLQAFIYFKGSPQDSRQFKFLVRKRLHSI